MPNGSCLVLLVEDEPAHMNLAQRAFRADERFQLITAKTLQDARQILCGTHPDLIIADLFLPDGRGTDLLSSHREEAMPLVVLTSHGDQQSAVEAMKAGARDYVVKSAGVLLELPRVAERVLREWEHIVARRQAERALRESEARFRGIFESEPECVSLHDRNGGVIDMNPAGLLILEAHSLAQVQNAGFPSFLNAEAERQFSLAVAAVFQGEERQLEFKIQTPSGAERQLDSNMVPLYGPDGQVNQMLAVTRDITKRRQAEERSRELWLQLAHVNRLSSMGEMASALAHEVNQPLGAIANYSGTCASLIQADRWSIDDVRRCLEKISEQALRAGAILARLKNFVAKTAPRPVPLEINQLIHSVLQLLKSDTQKVGGRVVCIFADDLPTIDGDAIQLQQVLVNLIRNAVEAMEQTPFEQRNLAIQSQAFDAHSVLISVSDTGAGISTVSTDDLFEPYFTTKTEGLGMGLSISRSIINAHGGRLWATNDDAGGATFRFCLPISRAPIPSPHLPPLAAKIRTQGNP